MIKIELFSSFLKNNFYLSIAKEITKRENTNHHIRKKKLRGLPKQTKSKLYFYYKEVILHLPHIRIKESLPKVPESINRPFFSAVMKAASIDATESVWKGAMASKLHKGRNPTKIAISAQL
jgi:hypothetical protein